MKIESVPRAYAGRSAIRYVKTGENDDIPDSEWTVIVNREGPGGRSDGNRKKREGSSKHFRIPAKIRGCFLQT